MISCFFDAVFAEILVEEDHREIEIRFLSPFITKFLTQTWQDLSNLFYRMLDRLLILPNGIIYQSNKTRLIFQNTELSLYVSI